MPRTTSALVSGIIQVQEGVDLTPFIVTANSLVTEVCSDSDYSDTGEGSTMEIIERWVAAHFYAMYDAQLSRAKAGSVAVSFQNKIDYGLRLSHWGQTAMILDTAGSLAALNNSAQVSRKIRVQIGWLGTEIPGTTALEG